MFEKVFHSIKDTFLYEYYLIQREAFFWKKGMLPLPHLLKQKIIAQYAEKYSAETFVETGTYMGFMVNAMRKRFKRLYSIELSNPLYTRASARFRRFPNITILEGDSGAVMPEILPKISGRILFWLDGHYSGGITVKGFSGCPICKELDAIADHQDKHHVVLVDDMRFFGKEGNPTIETIEKIVKTRLPDHSIILEDDIIRIVPRTINDIAAGMNHQ